MSADTSERWLSTAEAAQIAGHSTRRSFRRPMRDGRIRHRMAVKKVDSLGAMTGLRRTREVIEIEETSLLNYLASRRRGGTRGLGIRQKRHARGEACRCSTCRSEGLRLNVNVYLSDEQYTWLQQEAAVAGVRMGEIVRQALAEYEMVRAERKREETSHD